MVVGHQNVDCASATAEDLTYLLFFIGYQYYFAVLKLYALCTLHITTWGTRAGVGGEAAVKPGSQATADSTELKLEMQHKNHIERKAALERRRVLAEKTYAAGDIALLRRVHAARVDGTDAPVRVYLRPFMCRGRSVQIVAARRRRMTCGRT